MLETLYERVYAAPDDDQARMVLADALTESGDPRGEFIVIQLTAPGGRARGMARLRELQLRRELGPGWLPPGVRVGTARFRRGFPAELTLTGPTDPSHPAWRTVERLHVAEVELPSARSPIGGRVRPALRAVLGAGPGLAQELIAVPPPRLEALSLFCSHEQLWKTVGPGLARLGTLTDLEIAIPSPPGVAPDAGTRAIASLVKQHQARLTRLRVPSVSALPSEAQDYLRKYAPGARLELVYLERPGGEAWLQVDAERVSMHVRDPVPPVVLEVMRSRLRQSGLLEVELVDETARTRQVVATA